MRALSSPVWDASDRRRYSKATTDSRTVTIDIDLAAYSLSRLLTARFGHFPGFLRHSVRPDAMRELCGSALREYLGQLGAALRARAHRADATARHGASELEDKP